MSSTLELNCLVLNGDPNPSRRIFQIKILATETVAALKEAIKQKQQHALQDLDADTLDLWKVSFFSDKSLEANLRGFSFVEEESLSPVDRLSKIFSDPLIDGHLHVIVRRPHADIVELSEYLDKVPDLCSNFDRVLNKVLEHTPSEGSKSQEYAKLQASQPVFDGRYDIQTERGMRIVPPTQKAYTDAVAVPIVLFHPVFARFFDDVQNEYLPVPKDVLLLTVEFFRASSAIYPKEDDRRDALTHLLNQILEVDFVMGEFGRAKPNGHSTIQADYFKMQVLSILRELKNEIGTGGGCSCAQANLSYIHFWSQKKLVQARNASCCPSILLSFVGPIMIVSGAIITDKVIVQQLTDAIRVVDVPLQQAPYKKLAHVFYSLRLALARLKVYWKTLLPSDAPLTNSHPRYYPHISSFRQSNQVTMFRYAQYLEDHHQCVTFLAELDNPKKQVVVKFVHRYSELAHSLAAKAGVAPKLIYFGPVDSTSEDAPSYEGLQMVVMDYVDGHNALSLARKRALPSDFIQQVTHAVKVLHDNDPPIVFGDLRLQNIMVTKDNKVQLIDFDWPGVHDRDQYPMRMSDDSQLWAAGMGRLEIMRTEHDLAMIAKMQERIG